MRASEVDFHVAALIPEDYIADIHRRLIEYKRIASAADEVYTAFSSYRTNPEGVVFSRCRHNRYGDVERALKQGGEGVAAARDAHGNTLLHVAAQNGLKRIAKLLLRHGAALDAQNNKGATPLHYCFTYGYGGLGQYLIGKGADQGARDCEGRTCFDVQRAQPNQASVPLTALAVPYLASALFNCALHVQRRPRAWRRRPTGWCGWPTRRTARAAPPSPAPR